MTSQTDKYVCHATGESGNIKFVFSVEAGSLTRAVALAEEYAGETDRVLVSCRNVNKDFLCCYAVADAQRLLDLTADAEQAIHGYFKSEEGGL